MTVAAQLKSAEGGGLANLVADQLVEGAVQRPGRRFDGVGRRAAQETAGALGVDIGAVLKGAVQPGDEGDLLLQLLERIQGWSQDERMNARGEVLLRELLLVACEFGDARALFPSFEKQGILLVYCRRFCFRGCHFIVEHRPHAGAGRDRRPDHRGNACFFHVAEYFCLPPGNTDCPDCSCGILGGSVGGLYRPEPVAREIGRAHV